MITIRPTIDNTWDPCPICHAQAFMDASDGKGILCPTCGIRAKDAKTWNQLARLPKTVAVGVNWRTHFLQVYPDRATALRFIEFDAGDSLEEKSVVTDQEPTKVDPVAKPANSPQPRQVVFLLDGHQYTGTSYPPTTLFGECKPLEGTTQSLRGNTLGEMAHCSKCGWTGSKERAEEEDHTAALLQNNSVFQCAFP